MFQQLKLIVGSFAIVVGAYALYSVTMVPLIEPSISLERTADASEADVEAARMLVPQQRQQLSAWFREGDWELDNPKILETATAKLLLKDYRDLGAGRVEIRPCTMVLFPRESYESEEERQRQAVLVRAPEGAILQFDAPFDLQRGKIGNLVGGNLNGRFTIDSDQRLPGPDDDLHIECRDAVMANNQIVSPHPLEFQMGPNHGSGRGVTIQLVASQATGAPKKAGPGFDGVRSFSLQREVKMHVEPGSDSFRPAAEVPLAEAPTKEPAGEAAPDQVEPPLEIECAGPFLFDLQEYVATFHDRVNVVRIVPDGRNETLTGDRLSLFFTTKEPPDPKKPMSIPKLEPGRIEAHGSPVVLLAPADEVEARGTMLMYDLQSGHARLEGEPQAILRRGKSEIHAPQLRFQPNDQGRWGEFSATGPGWLEGHVPDDETQTFRADWAHQVNLRPQDGEQLLSLTGGARIEMGGQGHIAAERIFAWLPNDPPEGAPANDERGMLPNRMTATGDVQFAFTQVDGTVDELRTWFERVPLPAQPAPAVAATQPPPGPRPAPAPAPAPPPETKPEARQQHFSVAGGVLEALVRVRGEETELAALRVQHDLKVVETQTAEPHEEPFSLAGDSLYVDQIDPRQSMVTLSGQPARVAGRGTSLIGGEIKLNRMTNHLLVDGPGEMTLPVNQDLDGNPTPEMVPLWIGWSGQMELAGRSARFEREIRLSQEARRMATESMEVILTEPIVFAPGESGGPTPQVAQIICRGGVQLDSETIELGQRMSIERMQLVDLTLDQITGNINGRGPGRVRVVRRGGADDSLLGGGASGPLAGRPATQRMHLAPAAPSDEGLTFLGVDFKRDLSGNLHSRQLVFRHMVRAAYGPVTDWEQEIVPTDFDRPLQEGLLLSCDQLELAQPLTGSGGARSMELTALENTEVEGQNTDGTYFAAQAARLAYAEAKDLLILEGDGRSDARLWRWDRPGGPRSEAAFRKIRYWRSTNEATIDDAQMVDFSLLPGLPESDATRR